MKRSQSTYHACYFYSATVLDLYKGAVVIYTMSEQAQAKITNKIPHRIQTQSLVSFSQSSVTFDRMDTIANFIWYDKFLFVCFLKGK